MFGFRVVGRKIENVARGLLKINLNQHVYAVTGHAVYYHTTTSNDEKRSDEQHTTHNQQTTSHHTTARFYVDLCCRELVLSCLVY